MSSCLYVALARKLKQYSPYQLVVSSDKISGNSFNSIFFLFNPNLERDSNSLATARFQAALIIHNLVQILIICRGWGRCYIASGQAGKARCVILIIDRPYFPAKRSMQFNYLCSLDQFVIGTANKTHDRLSLARMLMLKYTNFGFYHLACTHVFACICHSHIDI